MAHTKRSDGKAFHVPTSTTKKKMSKKLDGKLAKRGSSGVNGIRMFAKGKAKGAKRARK